MMFGFTSGDSALYSMGVPTAGFSKGFLMRGLVVSSGVCAGLAALSAQGRVQPYYAPVPISADAIAADPSLANYETWDLRVAVSSNVGTTALDRFQVSQLNVALSAGNLYSPVGGADVPVAPASANLPYDTYVTVPTFQLGANQGLNGILLLGTSDLFPGPGSNVPIMPRAGEQQSTMSVAWGTLNPTLYNGDYPIARITVSKNATGPLAGYVLSKQTGTLDQQNFATLSFNNGVLTADPGSEFALLGDTNHDNQVNTADFAALGQHYNQSNSGWSGGDFNGDRMTNALDFNALASSYGANTSGHTLGNLVPEPTTLAMLAASLFVMKRRRK